MDSLTHEALFAELGEDPLSLFALRGAEPPLYAYLAHLVKWNRVMNLVGPDGWRDIVHTLIVDSAHLALFLESLGHCLPPEAECWDLGAGAGLPGIPLRMLWSGGTYTLVEAREKRALFLQTVLALCGLSQRARVFRGRVERFMPARPPANLVVSRAFMPWEKMLGLVGPHVAPAGLVVFLTLEPAPQEQALAAFEGQWQVEALYPYRLGPLDEEQGNSAQTGRFFWALRKTS